MPWDVKGKNLLLTSGLGNSNYLLRLHSGHPGLDPDANDDNLPNDGAGKIVTFAAASNGVRALSAPVLFEGLGANAAVTYFTLWDETGTDRLAYEQVPGELDQAANAAGEYTATTDTVASIAD